MFSHSIISRSAVLCASLLVSLAFAQKPVETVNAKAGFGVDSFDRFLGERE